MMSRRLAKKLRDRLYPLWKKPGAPPLLAIARAQGVHPHTVDRMRTRLQRYGKNRYR